MAIWLDRQYVLRITPYLAKFARKHEDLYNFRCPYCGDSDKSLLKARGYIYRKLNNLFFRCHNCGVGTTLEKFIEYLSPALHQEYILERWKAGEDGHHNYRKPSKQELKDHFFSNKKLMDKPFDLGKYKERLVPLSRLPKSHFAVKYVTRDRGIFEEDISRLYFLETGMRGLPNFEESNDTTPRIVFPYFNFSRNLTGFSARALMASSSSLRYAICKIDENFPCVFGLDKLQKSSYIFATEGGFDALSTSNGLAVSGADFSKLGSLLNIDPSFQAISIVFDNEPRNQDTITRQAKIIEAGWRVFIWPSSISNGEAKDLNNLRTKKGMGKKEIDLLIRSNTFQGLEASLRFNQWKKR